MRIFVLLATLFLLAGCKEQSTTKQLSPEMAAARTKALNLCSGCHGPTGVGTSPINPNLAGQKKAYLVKQLMDFRSGERNNYLPMTYIAKMLTEKEVVLVSEWYSSIENH